MTQSKRFSKPYKRGKRLFRYDFENCIVELVYKASEEEKREEEEWIKSHGYPLYDIDDQGLMIANSVGLSKENWKKKAVRDEYLDGWNFELDEELYWMTKYGL